MACLLQLAALNGIIGAIVNTCKQAILFEKLSSLLEKYCIMSNCWFSQ